MYGDKIFALNRSVYAGKRHGTLYGSFSRGRTYCYLVALVKIPRIIDGILQNIRHNTYNAHKNNVLHYATLFKGCFVPESAYKQVLLHGAAAFPAYSVK